MTTTELKIKSFINEKEISEIFTSVFTSAVEKFQEKHDCDNKSLEDIKEEVQELLIDYMNDFTI